MIQRVQTIYLLLALVLMLLLLVFPVFTIDYSVGDGAVFHTSYLNGNGFVDGDGKVLAKLPLNYFYITLALLTATCVLLYKKRPRQLLFTRLNLILHVLFVAGIYAVYFSESLVVKGIENTSGKTLNVQIFLDTGFFLIIPTVAFIWLAIRGIKRDELLVNSLDRLR